MVMEEWESLIEVYHGGGDHKEFFKVLKIAENVVDQDLAPFEADWFLSTLLNKPIKLLHVVNTNQTSNGWLKCVATSLKLLNNIVTKYESACKHYYDEIVTLCLLPYETRTRKEALSCLTSIICHSSIGNHQPIVLNQHLVALQDNTTCKEPLVLLVGAICEHHPNLVEEELRKIWQVFINLLESKDRKGKVVNAVLQGILGLFKHFGEKLPLNIFYKKFVDCLKLETCEKTLCRLFRNHAGLFRERLQVEPLTRRILGEMTATEHSRGALRAIYAAVADVEAPAKMQEIIKNEIEPKLRNSNYYQKFTTLHILADIYRNKDLEDLSEHVDVQELEFDIRNGNVNYETCEAILWCVEHNILFCDRILQTAILFYDNFKQLKRTDVIIQSLLKAEKEVRTSAVIFLIIETSRSPKYQEIWRDLFNNTTPVENSCVIDDVLEYMYGMVEGFSDPLSALAPVLRSHARAHAALARALARAASSCARAVPVALVAALCSGTGLESISIDRCIDDEDKLQCALALVLISDDVSPVTEMMTALEIIFSRNDIDSSILSKAINKLEKVILKREIEDIRLNEIIRKVVKISKRIDRKKKDDRILSRDITLFLGIYGGIYSSNTQNDCNFLIASLENKISLDLPCKDGTLKINLQRVIYSAIEHEDVDALSTLCSVICANLLSKKDEVVQSVLIRVLVCLSHCDVDISCILTAVSLCDAVCAHQLMGYIMNEKSTRSRKILLEALEVLLKSEAEGGFLLQNVLENFLLIEDESKSQATTDILEKLLELVKGNSILCEKYLPDILVKVLKTQSESLIKTVTDVFVDKNGLYDRVIVLKTTSNVFKVLNVHNKMAVATIKMAVEFVKIIFEKKAVDKNILIYYFDNQDDIDLTILIVIKQIYNLDFDKSSMILNDFVLKDRLFGCNYFDDDEAIFDFIADFGDVLMKFESENTYKLLSRAIERLTVEKIISLNEKLIVCLSSLKHHQIKSSIETVLRIIPIKEITESVEQYSFEKEHERHVHALHVMLKTYDGPIMMEFSSYVRRWRDPIKKLFPMGYVDEDMEKKMAYFNDLVGVSLIYAHDDLISVMNEGDNGVQFFIKFMPITFKYLMRDQPLLLAGVNRCCTLLNDVVKYAARRNRSDEVVGAVDALWPHYSKLSSFDQNYSLIQDLSSKLSPESKPMKWVIKTAKEGSPIERIKLVMLLPAGGEIDVGSLLSPHLPPLRLMRGVPSCCFRTALDRLAYTNDSSILNIVATLADGDSTRGWWDQAIDMCMSTLATQADMRMLNSLYSRSLQGRGPGVNERLLVPLLRYTKPSLCEDFISFILEDLLTTLSKAPTPGINVYSYKTCLLNYVRVLNIIQIALEKIPKENIQSPRSLLYSKITGKVGDITSYLIKKVCILCFSLKTKILCLESAEADVVESYRLFQCKNYNTLVTAILLQDPDIKKYREVFNPNYLTNIIGDEENDLPIKEQWRQRVWRAPAPCPAAAPRSLRTRSASLRTRIFTRTLSENPLMFDLLLEEKDEPIEPIELVLQDNVLNRHPCAATLSSLLAIMGGMERSDWLVSLSEALTTEMKNVKWLLTQAICNSREELKPHASSLQPALLDVIVTTANDGKLNDLHVHILDTLILWGEYASENVDLTVDYLINTAIANRKTANVYWTLLGKLTKLLDIWKDAKPSWATFENSLADPKSDSRKVFQILKRVTKCKILIPELIPALINRIGKGFSPEEAELFGLALNISGDNEKYLKEFWKVLDKLRNTNFTHYIKLLYYVQRGYPKCCDDNNFRMITDLAPKITTGTDKLKCLSILSMYVQTALRTDEVVSMLETFDLLEHLHSAEGLRLLKYGLPLMKDNKRKNLIQQVIKDYQQLPIKVRLVAYEVLIKALELVLSPDSQAPPSKRFARESKSLLLGTKDLYTQSLLQGISRGVAEEGELRILREGVGRLLNEDAGVRFCESFHIAMVLAPKSKPEVNLAAVLDTFFHGMRDEKLNTTKLRDQPIEIESILSYLSKNDFGNDVSMEPLETKLGVNVQITLDKILDSLIKFSEKNPKAATSIILQLIKANENIRPGFDFASTLGSSVIESLTGSFGSWTINIARGFDVWQCDGLKQVIEKLLNKTKHTENEGECKLLQEEYKIRCLGPKQFVLGTDLEFDDPMSESSQNFTMNDMMATFGKLSNWDDLTSQQKRSIKHDLPPIWTDEWNFRSCVEELGAKEGPIWMQCMLSSYRNNYISDYYWLRDVDKWPRKLFDISSVSETVTWQGIKNGVNVRNVYLPSNIRPYECLAEWAARIMMRSICLQSLIDDDSRSLLSRSHALAWCESANERGLHKQVLECCSSVRGSASGLYKSQALKWLRQRVLADRANGLESNDNQESLKKALVLAEQMTPIFIENSGFQDKLAMKQLTLVLKRDLGDLNKQDIDSTMLDIKTRLDDMNAKAGVIECNKNVLESVFVSTMTFYDQLFERSEGASDKNELLHCMSKALKLIVELDLPPKKLSADIIINRLDEIGDELTDEVGEDILNSLQPIIQNLDTISLDQLKSHTSMFKGQENHVLLKYVSENKDVQKFKMRLSLIGDAEHLLLHYISQLFKINNKDEWTEIFNRMKKNIFENEYAGNDYRVLEKFKTNLNSIANFGSKDKEERYRVLTLVKDKLMKKKLNNKAIFLSHVCPELTKSEIARDECLSRMLYLKPGISVFRFEEKIKVFIDSIRRPAVLSARLSDGSLKQYMVKRGELVRTHCGAMRLFTTVQTRRSTHRGYNVTPLSNDCALIEYLEGHERLKKLIKMSHPIDDIMKTSTRGKDSELILNPSNSLAQFNKLCSTVPAYSLRSAVEANSVSVEDFMYKKSNFLEAICEMTIFSYLCGVSDRHLDNIMYNSRDGGACHVDCGAILQYGGPELPPARLTRNILALCDTQVLESRLQQLKTTLRGSSELILPAISVCFKWMGIEFMDKLPCIKSLIQGKNLSHNITIDALSKSTQQYKKKYIELLEDVSKDFVRRETYSVEEQVSSLLRQCTDQRILSVTRSGWEPWI